MTDKLDTLREQIDAIDEQLLQLFTQRAALAKSVADAKGLTADSDAVVYRPEREAMILRKVEAANHSLLSNQTLTLLFRELISACLALQKPLTVAYLGPEGTYSQAAVLKQFGHGVTALPVSSIEEVFREVDAGTADYGVVPTENSTEGGVNQTLDCLLQTELRICGEVTVPIHQQFLSKETDSHIIQRVYSHQQSLGQCRLWLNTNLPNVERIAVSSNAEAAKRAMNEPQSAAIAGQLAAELYGLNILASRIEDNVNNTTRFVVLGKQAVPASGQDKTSYVMSSPDKPGALHQLLSAFVQKNINMTRIESRPAHQGVWNYVYFIDVEGHIEDEQLAEANKLLKEHAAFMKHLGSYPRTML